MKFNRSAMAKARLRRRNDDFWYSTAIPGTMDRSIWNWLLKSWREGARCGHSCVEMEIK